MAKPMIKWVGGKRLMANEIISLLPEHTCYCEVFGGGGAVLLAKEPSRVEVYNDINGDLVSLFRVVRFHLDELLRELDWCVRSRQDFLDTITQPGMTEIQRAARFFLRIGWSFGGMGRHLGTHKTRSFASHANKMAALHEVQARLDGVLIEGLDYRKCIEKYDAKTTCFFLDPPYTSGAQYKDAPFTRDEHKELASVLHAIKGSWVLTYDDSEFVRGRYKDCTLKSISQKKGLKPPQGKRKALRQLIITPKEKR